MPTTTNTSPSSSVPAARAAVLVTAAAAMGRKASAQGSPRQRTALLALRCLAAFAEKQFSLFLHGFDDGTLEADPRYPAAFLVEATARQVSFDIDVLLRAMAHRNPATSTPEMRATLATADRLAAQALAPAIRHGLVEETAVLTYFQKSPTIRLMPYVPLASIGLDFGAMVDPLRLLAVAHEVGHHVYRQMTVNYAGDLDAQVVERAAAVEPASAWPAWLLAWEEELFADVYSVLVAGPVAGLAMQALLAAELPAALTYDDGDHPLGALRPALAPAVLRAVAAATGDTRQRDAMAGAAAALDRRWQSVLAGLDGVSAFVPQDATAAVPLASARATLESYVQELLAGVLAPIAGAAGAVMWSQGLTAEDAALESQLLAQFRHFLAQQSSAVVPELALEGIRRVVVAPQVAGVTGGTRAIGQIGDPYLDGLRDGALARTQQLRVGAWQAVFLAGDWVTEEGGSGIIPVRRSRPRRRRR